MRIKDGKQERWDHLVRSNDDPYGGEVIRFAVAWADLMESQIDAGHRLVDIASDTSYAAAGTGGMTMYMHAVAVNVLSEVWIHGEDLHRCYSSKYEWVGKENAS